MKMSEFSARIDQLLVKQKEGHSVSAELDKLIDEIPFCALEED